MNVLRAAQKYRVAKIVFFFCLFFLLSAATSSLRICQAVGENAVNESTAKHWFQTFSSGEVSRADEPRSGRPHVLNDEALKAAIKEDMV